MISAIVLAAGESKRMGRPKLLLLYKGKTIIEQTVDNILASQVGEVIVVIGHQAEYIKVLLKDSPVKLVFNKNYKQGMSFSIKAGMGKVSSAAQGALIMLGDQPGVTPDIINSLISNFQDGRGNIIVPVYKGQRGNPVLFDIKYKSELVNLTGDVGARGIVAAHHEEVYEVETGSKNVLLDIDTEEDFKRYTS